MNSRRNNVLIVDDNFVDRKLLGLLFKKRNSHIFVAENGYEAIDICRQQSFDLIIMNLNMPGLNGFDASREIRKLLSHNRNIPIIGITSNENDEERFRCLDAGMNDYYHKPVRMLYVDYIIDDWLTRDDVTSFAVS